MISFECVEFWQTSRYHINWRNLAQKAKDTMEIKKKGEKIVNYQESLLKIGKTDHFEICAKREKLDEGV